MSNSTSFSEIGVQPGAWLQIYLDAMRGGRTERLHHLDETARLYAGGVVAGVILHDFPRGHERDAAVLASECRSRMIPFAFSWGLDGTKDEDKTKLTVREKGECMGRVLAAHPDAWGGLNPEIKWERPGTDMNEAGALVLGAALRELAPDAVLCTQPWPAIEQHGDVRDEALPIGKGGPFRGWIDEFASFVDFHADQRYWENWDRPDRYRYLNEWAEREWKHVNAALAEAGLERPNTITIQGYEHDEQPWTVVDAVLSRRDRPVIVWSEPFPTASTIRALRVGPALTRLGFLSPSVGHRDAIRAFQTDAKIAVDGLAGNDTIKALGII